MAKYLFRAEAVNLSATVYDTSDISTVRGGGFYLLARIKGLTHEPEYKEHKVTEGASAAVFKIDTDNPDLVREEMLGYLYGSKRGEPIREMMFLVEFVEVTENFPEDMARLLGKLRTAQMKTSGLRILDHTLSPKIGMHFDELNRVLPAHIKDGVKGQVSSFTDIRRKQGIILRPQLYDIILKEIGKDASGYDFTKDLEDLSEDKNKGNLNGKIAFIYIDGNKFGGLQRNFSEEQCKAFDKMLQDFKARFLSEILSLTKIYPSFLNGVKVRLETLLWGGDEIKMIVPAWMGWKIATLFFDLAGRQGLKIDNKSLTYAMGLVFANHKNPVANVSKIAWDLAETVKDELRSGDAYHTASGNRMHIAVLESLEILPARFAEFCKVYYGATAAELALTTETAADLSALAKLMNRAQFPRTRIYKAASAWKTGRDDDYARTVQAGMNACELNSAEKLQFTTLLENLTGTFFTEGSIVSQKRANKGFRWIQLTELWDYLVWEEI